MADTIEFEPDDTGWTDVSTGGLEGFITNKGSKRVFYREDATDPTASADNGHELMSKASVNFSLTGSQKVWVRVAPNGGVGKILVTPGD